MPSNDLISMVGRLLRQRPGLSRELARDFINDRLRALLDRRPQWSGLLKPVTVTIPTAYTAGTVTLVTGKALVTGLNTNWPVTDMVNTTISEQVNTAQQLWVTPASLDGISLETVLLVDVGNDTQMEILPVQDIRGTRILLNFSKAHPAGVTLSTSSLAGLQFRISGQSPVYTVLAVTSPTTLYLDQGWSGIGLSAPGYRIVKMYTTIDPMCREIVSGSDPFQNIDLDTNISQESLNRWDPSRETTNSPVGLSPRGPTRGGIMQWEIWPPQTTAYQLDFLIHTGWPDLLLPSDQLPPFVQPNAVLYGALADAFRTPIPRPPDGKDPGYNPQTANDYEGKFEQAALELINADEFKRLTMFTYNEGGLGMGANWNQSHDADSAAWNF